jgi:hypothetical protein
VSFKLPHRTAVEEANMQAAVVPAVSGSWEVKDVPQPQPGPSDAEWAWHSFLSLASKTYAPSENPLGTS